MTIGYIHKANLSKKSGEITFECLALPNSNLPPGVEVVHEDGTANTDLDASDTFVSLLEALGLNEDPEGHGCNTFYLTVSTERPPA